MLKSGGRIEACATGFFVMGGDFEGGKEGGSRATGGNDLQMIFVRCRSNEYECFRREAFDGLRMSRQYLGEGGGKLRVPFGLKCYEID